MCQGVARRRACRRKDSNLLPLYRTQLRTRSIESGPGRQIEVVPGLPELAFEE